MSTPKSRTLIVVKPREKVVLLWIGGTVERASIETVARVDGHECWLRGIPDTFSLDDGRQLTMVGLANLRIVPIVKPKG